MSPGGGKDGRPPSRVSMAALWRWSVRGTGVQKGGRASSSQAHWRATGVCQVGAGGVTRLQKDLPPLCGEWACHQALREASVLPVPPDKAPEFPATKQIWCILSWK